MYEKNGRFYFSPSDLTLYMESPFAAWMERFALHFPHKAPDKDPANSLMSSLAEKGYSQEQTLQKKFEDEGRSLVKIDGNSPQEKLKKTVKAMQDGIDIIVQARLETDFFVGYSDFLVKITHEVDDTPSLLGNWHYEVWDSKLSSKTKTSFIVQLCCYAEMLNALQGITPKYITLAMGDKTQLRLRTHDFFAYYRTLKASFCAFHKNFNPEQRPDPADSKNWGDWSQYAEQLLVEQDHLFQVATITRGQIKKLQKAGIQTMQQLADLKTKHISKIQTEVLARLKAQAQIQKRSLGKDKPEFMILKPQPGTKTGLGLLPPHSPLDVFFDIEGYPLMEGGLEYLWGCTYFNQEGKRAFIDFWAHDREQEKQAFVHFINWVYERFQKDKKMHIYHYANYEIAACRKLMGRFAVCEHEVDQLLRNEVFVDLYKIVKGGLLVGEPRYSIKNVEHLYRSKRQTDVGCGSDSVVVYEQWQTLYALGKQGDSWQTSDILRGIRDYNIDDCNSTQELVDWLRVQQAAHSIVYTGKPQKEPEAKEELTNRSNLKERLLQRAEKERLTNPNLARLTENLAWMLEFYWREAKPVFWRLFSRLGLTDIELIDDLDCLALCERTEKEPYKNSARSKNLVYEYRFDPAQNFKGAQKRFYLLGEKDKEDKPISLVFLSAESNLENGLIALQAKEEPPSVVTLVPDEYINPNPIPQAIENVVRRYEKGQLKIHKAPILQFLKRAKPKITGHRAGPITTCTEPQLRLEQIIQAAKNLDHSYLTIQGPPGAGKTYTAKRIIAALVQTGACVGITSNSHKAINNLLLSTARYCKSHAISAAFCCSNNSDPELSDYQVSIVKNSSLTSKIQPGCVIGTTAWGFARDDMIEQLDYLFVDEAGQVAVANLIAMSRACTNLILLGDQMQLGRPAQGTHPADSGLSILDYLLHETAIIPADMGVFLDTTYRMHSAINSFISAHIYEGKLKSHPTNDQRIIEVPKGYQGPLRSEAGIVFVPVLHAGNTQASDEEVLAIKKLTQSLLGRTLHSAQGGKRPITWQDMLFVAPYNHQVSKLSVALGAQATVGSVDKFQGQEAAIVFLSLCASNASESPRGLEFLLEQNRLNVALSRAQSLVVVVANPDLAQGCATQIKQLKLINLFCALKETVCTNL